MASKPKACKYGCGTIITWDDRNRKFDGPDGQKHDCRDWDKSTFPPAASSQQLNNPSGGGSYSYSSGAGPTPDGETLIGVQAKKTWENYFKFLEVIAANTAAIASSSEDTNKLINELGTKLQSLEESLTVQKMKTNGQKKKEEEVVQNGA